MTEAFERERELNARERIEQLEAQLEACKDINGGITTENIRLNGKYRKLLEWYQQLEAENKRLREAGDGLLKVAVGMLNGSVRPYDFSEHLERVETSIANWREACDE